MTNFLPPLALLPAFDAAGRHGSFKAAACELHVTPSAISQQIKSLEESLGVTLFERGRRTVSLTEEGHVYLQEIQLALADLAAATRRVQRRAPSRILRITTTAFVACEFLIPRLPRFRSSFPGVELRTESSTHLVNFAIDPCDAALRIGGAPAKGVRSSMIGGLYAAPICRPDLAAEIRELEDVFRFPLIELRSQEPKGWRMLNEHLPAEQLIVLDTYLECVRAVEQGLGIGYGVFPLTTEWVANGRLAVPLPMRIPIRSGLCWVYREADRSALLDDVGAWFKEQFEELSDLC